MTIQVVALFCGVVRLNCEMNQTQFNVFAGFDTDKPFVKHEDILSNLSIVIKNN